MILQRKFNQQTCCFAPDEEILAEITEILLKEGIVTSKTDAKKLCMPFRQLGLEEVEVYSAGDPDNVSKAGPHASVLEQIRPPSPGNPTAIFVTSCIQKCLVLCAATMDVVVLAVILLAMAGHSSGTWCECREGLSEAMLQKTLDYACGAGADCVPIHQNGPCFNPNTVRCPSVSSQHS
ncbi:hypothetical protein CARUB_v10025011mg [Capsella rubella]|uniref:X8 domain-containing protein n=1 Tax=Capsella rubella TaxID=81985 RepID=R0HGG5_9BRAS|nr:hypothetical protein CARUB_v10025011mg [Capsella rubella]